jgi:hypothetical protein
MKQTETFSLFSIVRVSSDAIACCGRTIARGSPNTAQTPAIITTYGETDRTQLPCNELLRCEHEWAEVRNVLFWC